MEEAQEKETPEQIREDIGNEDGEEYTQEDKLKQLNLLFQNIRGRLRKNNDMAQAVSGPEGCGKSTLGIKVAMKIDPNFKINTHLLANPNVEELQDILLKKLPPRSAIVVDEAIRVAYKRNFFSFDNRFMAEMFSVSRAARQAVLMCIPNFKDLDSYFRNHRIKLWWYIPARGYCVVMMPWTSPFISDPWLMDENERIMRKELRGGAVSSFSPEDLMKALKKTKNYVMDFQFSALDYDLDQEYLQYKKHMQEQINYQAERAEFNKENQNVWKERYMTTSSSFSELCKYLNENDLMTTKAICKVLNKKDDYIKKLFSRVDKYAKKIPEQKPL